jgi:hypothetical protein
MEKVLAHIHATKCYERYECILISYCHKHLHICVISNQRVSCRSMIFLFHHHHVLCSSKLIFHRLIVQVYLRDTRRNTRRLGRWTSPRRHCLPGVHHSIEQSIPTKKAINSSKVPYLAFTKLNQRLHLTVHVLFHLHWYRQSDYQWACSASRRLHCVIWSLRPYTFPVKRSKL